MYRPLPTRTVSTPFPLRLPPAQTTVLALVLDLTLLVLCYSLSPGVQPAAFMGLPHLGSGPLRGPVECITPQVCLVVCGHTQKPLFKAGTLVSCLDKIEVVALKMLGQQTNSGQPTITLQSSLIGKMAQILHVLHSQYCLFKFDPFVDCSCFVKFQQICFFVYTV